MLSRLKAERNDVNARAGTDDHRQFGTRRIASVAVALILFSGGASNGENPTYQASGETNVVPIEKRDSKGMRRIQPVYDGHPTGASVGVREAARETYLFAQLSENAYGPFKPQSRRDAKRGKKAREEYKLPSYITERKPMHNTPFTGFAARVYDVKEPGKKPYVIVAFRGTNFTSPADWLRGNILNTQYRQGLKIVRDLKQQGSKVKVTGHSLGGGIATWVSLQEEDVPAYGFNASHRLTRGAAVDNHRHMVSQYGEVGVSFRRPFRNPKALYTTIPFADGGPLERHTMRYLADGLTSIAAADGDAAAAESVKVNRIVPPKFPLRR